jgi:hypothetical protein
LCLGHDRIMQRLRKVIATLDDLSDDETIYAAGASPSARAVVAREPDDGGVPAEAVGLAYFLEVSEAKESIRVWSAWRNGALPTLDDKVAAVIHYASRDSFLPVDPDPR